MSYWVLAHTEKGRPIVDGPHSTEDKALDWIMMNVPSNRREAAEIRDLPTRDSTRATRILKHGLIQKVGLDEGMRNATHPGNHKEPWEE